MEDVKDFNWIAYYNDGSVINQVNKDGTENKFGGLDQDKLVNFEVVDKDGNIFGVDLKTGVFNCNGEPAEFDGYSYLDEDYRLIYFKRNTIVFDFPNKKHTRIPFLGYQFTDSEGKNQKIMLSSEGDKYQIHVD